MSDGLVRITDHRDGRTDAERLVKLRAQVFDQLMVEDGLRWVLEHSAVFVDLPSSLELEVNERIDRWSGIIRASLSQFQIADLVLDTGSRLSRCRVEIYRRCG